MTAWCTTCPPQRVDECMMNFSVKGSSLHRIISCGLSLPNYIKFLPKVSRGQTRFRQVRTCNAHVESALGHQEPSSQCCETGHCHPWSYVRSSQPGGALARRLGLSLVWSKRCSTRTIPRDRSARVPARTIGDGHLA